jgi:hypothetical protein
MTRTTIGVLVASAAILAGCSGNARPSAGFWFEGRAFSLDSVSTGKLGGPLRAEDIDEIEKISRAELGHAFSNFNIDITARRDAHWRVSVVPTLAVGGAPPAAGGSVEFAGFGGRGSVAFVTLATIAIRRAPEAATRRELLAGIGRGIGAAAAHELAHQILGKAMRDDTTDTDSYEYFSADRKSQYFGSLHWTAAKPMLQQKLSNK